jgi:hypothetical protein
VGAQSQKLEIYPVNRYYSNRQGEEGHARPSAQFTRSRSRRAQDKLRRSGHFDPSTTLRATLRSMTRSTLTTLATAILFYLCHGVGSRLYSKLGSQGVSLKR